jgi:uncharacterized protein YbjT (DUF2867 family)
MFDNKTLGTGELIVLRWQNYYLKVFSDDLRNHKRLRLVSIINVDYAGKLVWNALLDGLDRLVIVVGLSRCIVIGGHYALSVL